MDRSKTSSSQPTGRRKTGLSHHRSLIAVLLLTACMSLGSAFQQSNPTPARWHSVEENRRSTSPSKTALPASRKGNRGPTKDVSDTVERRSRPSINDVLDGITDPPTFPNGVDPSDLPAGPASDDPLAPFVRTIVTAADMRKASDIVALRVTSVSSVTDFVVVVSGTSRPQNQAIAAAVRDDVEEAYGRRCLGNGTPEGSADSGWILLDYGEIMVHVMTPKSRLFYDMEGQWRDRGGEYMDISGWLVDESGGVGAGALEGGDGRSMRERLDVEEEADPFWS